MSQVIFNLDPKIKAKAMKRAKSQGVPFSAYLKKAAQAFAEGRASLEFEERVRPEKLKLWEKALREVDRGGGRRFNSAKEAIEYVENL